MATTVHLQKRRKTYFQLRSQLASKSDDALVRALSAVPEKLGWGRSQVLRMGSRRVFVKRVPVTAEELRHPHSTKNLYRLPLYYNYGVGSAGFGAFRELLTHIKTTGWVLEGASQNFPFMFHHRLVKASKGPRSRTRNLDDYVRYWAGSKRIGAYMRARREAKHELLIFLEHFPHTVSQWQQKNEDRVPFIHEEMENAVRFLGTKNVIHFDGHHQNVVTDGTRAYLTDFGLALDRDFDLSEKEREFFQRNRSYDHAFNHLNLAIYLRMKLHSLSKRNLDALASRYDIAEPLNHSATEPLLRNLEDIVDRGLLTLPPKNTKLILRARPLALLHNEFFAKMSRSPKKNIVFEDRKAKRLLGRITR